jgi:hypothetical protein
MSQYVQTVYIDFNVLLFLLQGFTIKTGAWNVISRMHVLDKQMLERYGSGICQQGLNTNFLDKPKM